MMESFQDTLTSVYVEGDTLYVTLHHPVVEGMQKHVVLGVHQSDQYAREAQRIKITYDVGSNSWRLMVWKDSMWQTRFTLY